MNPLESIELRLEELLLKRGEIDREINGLQEARKLLLPVYGQSFQPIPSIEAFIGAEDVGITDAVRGALRLNSTHKLSALQIRDIMEVHGFDVAKYTNSMATIHQVLQRLVKAGQIMFFLGNPKTYQWIEKSLPVPGSLGATLAGLPAPGLTPPAPQPEVPNVLKGLNLFQARPLTGKQTPSETIAEKIIEARKKEK